MLGLRVRRSEVGITISLAGYFFLLVAAQYLIKPARNALFLEGLGADRLPYVYIGTALATWVVMILYVRMAPRTSLVPLFRGTLVFLSVNLLAFWWLLPSMGDAGLYYYYNTFAKALDAIGQDVFVDESGVKHNWRAELVAELARRQKSDGSWANENARWLEGDSNLATGYALLALSYCQPKQK